MAKNERDLTQWFDVTMAGKIRKGKGKWWQFERKDGRKFILTEVEQFVEERKPDPKASAF